MSRFIVLWPSSLTRNRRKQSVGVLPSEDSGGLHFTDADFEDTDDEAMEESGREHEGVADV